MFKEIQGYEGLYSINEDGLILRHKRTTNNRRGVFVLEEKFLSTTAKANGYIQTTLTKDKSKKHFSVHRLVAQVFIPNPDNKPCINHKDGNRSNNNVNNLEWCTHSENNLHAFRTLNKAPTKGCLGKFGAEHHSSKPVIQWSLSGQMLNTFAGQHEASRMTGVNRGNISGAISGRYKTAGGFNWTYKDGAPVGILEE